MSKPYSTVIINTYIHLLYTLTLKGRQEKKKKKKRPTPSFSSIFFQTWEGLQIYHVLVLPEYKQNGSLVRISSRLKFGCHGWVHRLSSPQSLFKKERRLNHHSFLHTQLPQPRASAARWRGSVTEDSLLLTQQGGLQLGAMNTFRVLSVKFSQCAIPSKRKVAREKGTVRCMSENLASLFLRIWAKD